MSERERRDDHGSTDDDASGHAEASKAYDADPVVSRKSGDWPWVCA